jgi:hypothetical protein
LELLFQKGASLETEDHQKRRPIHHATIAKEHAMVQLLAALGAGLNVVDAEGNIPTCFVKSDVTSEGKSMKHLLNNLMQQNPETRVHCPLPENLSFKGRGLEYLDALLLLKEKKIPIKRVTGQGTSALLATLFALGFEDLRSALESWENYLDIEEKHLPNLKILFEENGLIVPPQPFSSGEKLRLWLEELLFRKTKIPHLTFGELKTLPDYKHLLFFGEEVHTKERIRFDSSDPKCAKIIVSDALRIALGIPFLLAPHPLYIKKEGKRVQKGSKSYAQLPSDKFPSVAAYDSPRYQKQTMGFEIPSPLFEDPKTFQEHISA